MKINVSDINKTIDELSSALNTLKNKFNCKWNDDVYLSFKDYLFLCNREIKNIEELNKKNNSLTAKVNNLKVDEHLKKNENDNKSAKDLIRVCQCLAQRSI